MPDARNPSLVSWLEFLSISDCTCEFDFRSLGRLDRVSMGKGWVRLTTNPTCPTILSLLRS